MTNAAAATALVYLHERGELTRVVDAALPAVKQMLQSSPDRGLDPSGIDNILLKIFSAEHMRMLASASDSPAFKVLHERELFEEMSKRVIDRAIETRVDNGPKGTWPGGILVKATKRLCKDVDGEPLTPFKIDRVLSDIVVEEGFGSFFFDGENKRHLRLNPNGYNGKYWD
jgi:hypothetical protein